MLDEEFLRGLDAEFPRVFARAAERVTADRDMLLRVAQSDERRARLLARPYGAALLWWPYLRNAVPAGERAAPAYEAVLRIVLLVDRLHGWEPNEHEAREQVNRVLRKAFDPLELRGMLEREVNEGGRLAWAAPVVTPLLMPLMTPGGMFSLWRKAPFAILWSAGIVAATLATMPLVTGWSIAGKAERDARLQPRQVDSVAVSPQGPPAAEEPGGPSSV